MNEPRYKMRISRLTVDKLGVKLYDKVSAVIAELVANSYDADAPEVTVRAPMGELLATSHQGKIIDKGYSIEVSDTGCGMTPDEVNKYYLVVGAERRKDGRGDVSKRFQRKIMGRKGVGKLAPFGICETIELITAGGEKISGVDQIGKPSVGYLTAHLVLDGNEILQPVESEYEPAPGALDGTISKRPGTKIILRDFYHRHVPTMEEFNRQLAQRFGIQTNNWAIKLVDNLKTEGSLGSSTLVGLFSIDLMPDTRVELNPTPNGGIAGRVFGPDGNPLVGYSAGFTVDGRDFPIRGWIGYARDPYKDDLMAGVRIYCRGKIAAQTNVFNQRAGFTGEHDVRSYLVGELRCDWLDDEDDLIQTDRRDILWSHELGQAFEQWGQAMVKKIGSLSRNPMRVKVWDLFRETTGFEELVKNEFPLPEQDGLRHRAMEIGKLFGQTARRDEVADPEQARNIAQLSIMLAPVVALDDKLREAAESDHALGAIAALLRTARIAELASFGRIADDRIRVIRRVEALKDDGSNLEAVFQELIEYSPWLIDPQWSPIAANEAFSTLKREFAKFYESKTGEEINLDDFSDDNKRADFIMSSQDSTVQIVEIKRPGHALRDDELTRIVKYHDLMDEFLKKPGNQEFLRLFSDFHITLVCDELGLGPVGRQAFSGLVKANKLTHLTWQVFLMRTRKMHEVFLQEAERQRKNASIKKQD